MWETILSTIGIFGAVLVSYSNIPQLVMFFKQGHAKGISVAGTWIAFVGLVGRAAYLYYATGGNAIALGPYVFSFLSVFATLYYCYFPKDVRNDENQ